MTDGPPVKSSNRGEPDWKGLLKWSAKYSTPDKSEGGGPAPESVQAQPRPAVTEADARWFEKAVRANMIDEVGRMKEIAAAITLPAAPDGMTEDELLNVKVALLEELQDLVESIDNATDLKVIGGFDALMQLFQVDAHPRLSAAAAEVLATSVQNNEKAQQWALDGGALPALLKLLTKAVAEKQTQVIVKSVLALSSLVRNFAPARDEFRQLKGYENVAKAVSSGEPKVVQKVTGMFGALAREGLSREEVELMTGRSFLTTLAQRLEDDEQAVREAVLRFFVSSFDTDKIRIGLRENVTIEDVIKERYNKVSKLTGEEAEVAEDELSLLQELLTLSPTCSTADNQDKTKLLLSM